MFAKRRIELALPALSQLRRTSGLVSMALLMGGHPAHAERADRGKPIAIESDGEQPGLFDLNKHTAVLAGHVVITQGTLQIHAARVEVTEDRDGPKLATAFGAPGAPARFRQKGDLPDEWCEGDAARIEYDGVSSRVRFVGDAHLRVIRGTTVTDSANAAVVTYDADAGTISSGGTRTMLMLSPRAASDASSAAAPTAAHP